MSNSIKQPAAKVIHSLLQLQRGLGVMEEANMKMSATGQYNNMAFLCRNLHQHRSLPFISFSRTSKY
ncbi:hypothetical protein DsansV1_C22g0172281 [Dioscorea sansibarensis]